MNVEIINPFVDATKNAFGAMLSMEVAPGKPWLRTKENPTGNDADVFAVIGMSGNVKGNVTLGFSNDAARKMVARFVGDSDGGTSLAIEEVGDGVGELVNLITGGAKATLATRLKSELSISVPTVFSGEALKTRPERFPVLVVPFETDLGAFYMEIAIEAKIS